MLYRNNDPMALSAMEADHYSEPEEYEPRKCFSCPECGAPVFEDERYYIFDGNIICDSCIEHHERTAVWGRTTL